MLRRADLRDRIDASKTADRQLFWTVPIAAAVSTLVMAPSGLTSVVLIFAVTTSILSLFAWRALGKRREERQELSRELDAVERRIERGSGALPRDHR